MKRKREILTLEALAPNYNNNDWVVYTDEYLLLNMLAGEYEEFMRFMRGQTVAILFDRPAYYAGDWDKWLAERARSNA